MYRKFREVWTCAFWDMRTDRQIYAWTDVATLWLQYYFGDEVTILRALQSSSMYYTYHLQTGVQLTCSQHRQSSDTPPLHSSKLYVELEHCKTDPRPMHKQINILQMQFHFTHKSDCLLKWIFFVNYSSQFGSSPQTANLLDKFLFYKSDALAVA